jgi:hypothetical protein
MNNCRALAESGRAIPTASRGAIACSWPQAPTSAHASAPRLTPGHQPRTDRRAVIQRGRALAHATQICC